MRKPKRPRKWIQSPDARNIGATVLIWIWEKVCKLIDRLTYDEVSGKSWVKKDRTAPLRSADASRPEYGEERPTLPPAFIPETDREKFLRESYATRRATPAELVGLKLAVQKLVEQERARRASMEDIERICREASQC